MLQREGGWRRRDNDTKGVRRPSSDVSKGVRCPGMATLVCRQTTSSLSPLGNILQVDQVGLHDPMAWHGVRHNAL
ncbi:MAG: hypothetical protein IKR13_05255, partial [Victivallales bacterium]|nr:hypothetical protein [Victivallales bacterium]